MAKKGLLKPLLLTLLFPVLGVGLVWLSFTRGDGRVELESPLAGTAEAAQDPWPTTPQSWHGAIDYHWLDQRASMLVQQNDEVIGMAIGIVENGRISFIKGYGWADKESQLPVTEHSLFRWASVSKSVAATMAYKLSAEGKLALDAPLSSWHSSLALPQHAEEQITLVDLMAHRTGLTKNAYDSKLESGERAAILRMQLISAPQQCQPGTCYTYQNVAWDTLSEIITRAGGKPYRTQVSEQLFIPLGMSSANMQMDGLVLADDWARPYHKQRAIEVNDNYYRVPAAAGVNSNIIDFTKWMQAQLGTKPAVLPDNLLQALHQPRVRTGRVYGGAMARALKDPAYGQGWRSFTYQGHRLFGHSGAVNGYRSTMMYDPELKSGIAILWNANAGAPFRMQMEFLDELYGLERQNWLDLKEEQLPADIIPQDQMSDADRLPVRSKAG